MQVRDQESVITAEFDLCECFALIKKIQKLCDDLEGRKLNLQIRKTEKKRKTAKMVIYDYL